MEQAPPSRQRVGNPPAHRALIAFSIVVLVVMLAVQGVSTRSTGSSSTLGPGGASAGLGASNAVLAFEGHRLRPQRLRLEKTIALSFDDGPDPRWTPRIAATLKR